jgi:cellulose synthase/poly-beta-1,6-N-acetylglucosamine synthase-like glycosyltransferase
VWEVLCAGVFWSALGLLAYVHFGYPLVLVVLRRVRPRPVARADVHPRVDLLIGAYNEKAVIRQKIENCLALDYPRDRLRILVASDVSNDGTDDIVREYTARGVELVVAPRRRGKAANFREIVPTLTGDIVVFSDAGSLYRGDTLKKLIRNFADPQVGCVGGRIRYRNPDATSVSQGEGLYWRYEVFLREAESAIGSAMVLSGAVYAMRRELYRAVPDDLPDDFLSPLHVLDQGRRVLYEADSEIWETMATSARGEMLTKVRIIASNFAALRRMRHLLNPFRDPLLALQLFSHRFLRWFVLPLAFLLLVSSLGLVHRPIYLLVVGGQVIFYGLAGVGWLMDLGGKRSRLAFLPYYFVLVNLAAAWGVWKGFAGRWRGVGVWEPVER